jgi:hypothetical protein
MRGGCGVFRRDPAERGREEVISSGCDSPNFRCTTFSATFHCAELTKGTKMKNLMIDVLIKLSKVEVEAKELVAQVEAQSLLIAALVLSVGKESQDDISTNIHNAVLAAAKSSDEILQSDVELILSHFDRLLKVTRFVAENAEE